VNREAIAAALFNLAKTPSQLVTTSRRLKHWSDVPAEEQPALFQTQGKENIDTGTQRMGGPNTHKIDFQLYVYVHNTDPTIPPSALLNALLDALEAALTPTPGTKQTLGGLAQHAFISGSIETDEGVLGDQAVAIVPIEVLAV
jgi:hypothetical protein